MKTIDNLRKLNSFKTKNNLNLSIIIFFLLISIVIGVYHSQISSLQKEIIDLNKRIKTIENIFEKLTGEQIN
jgi:ABC-type enterochelin transport system permease subunit